MDNLRFLEVYRYARVPIEQNCEPGEQVVIVADSRTPPVIWQALAAAVQEVGGEATVFLMPPRKAYGHEPTSAASTAIQMADLAIDATTQALGHTDAIHFAREAGKKIIYMNGLTVDMLAGGAVEADVDEMNRLGKIIRQRWTDAKEVHITSDLGTDLRASVEGRKGFYIAVKIHRTPDNFMTEAAFPDGEAGVAPVEGTGEGVIVWDTTAEMLGRLSEPIRLTVRKGEIVEIEGGTQAEQLSNIIETMGDENSRNCPAEISIGLNPKVQVSGYMRQDKKLLGACHIALGSSREDGGAIHSRIHIDGVVRRPTIALDGEVIVERGNVLL